MEEEWMEGCERACALVGCGRRAAGGRVRAERRSALL